jgi:hypothetical protein
MNSVWLGRVSRFSGRVRPIPSESGRFRPSQADSGRVRPNQGTTEHLGSGLSSNQRENRKKKRERQPKSRREREIDNLRQLVLNQINRASLVSNSKNPSTCLLVFVLIFAWIEAALVEGEIRRRKEAEWERRDASLILLDGYLGFRFGTKNRRNFGEERRCLWKEMVYLRRLVSLCYCPTILNMLHGSSYTMFS